MKDKEVELLIKKELIREEIYLDLIPSENYASQDVLDASGSVFTNKYAEGYPKKRYYPGVEVVDELEELCIERAKKVFNCNFANVQALSGSTANLAIYLALLRPGDRIVSMNLNHGGHLSHGAHVSVTGKFYNIFHYGVDEKTEMIDYDKVKEICLITKPKLIVAGASNYSRKINWKKFKAIADLVGAYLVADISHISALVVTNLHPNPFPYADVVMTTMQKQIRGARGAIILSNNEEIAKKIDNAVFPGIQGGPQENIIAGKAVTLFEVMQPFFKTYCKNMLANNKALCDEFIKAGYHVISGGTDNHLFCVDVFSKVKYTSDIVEKWLQDAHILANKNTIPFEKNSPRTPSGIRMGSPAGTTRGLKVEDFQNIGKWMVKIINSKGDEKVINEIKVKVLELLKKHPIYKDKISNFDPFEIDSLNEYDAKK